MSSHVSQARQFVTEWLGNIRQLLAADVQAAKAELAKHVSGIRMVPEVEGKRGHYVASGEWSLLDGYEDSDPALRVRSVAGVGFEPTTFGL